MFVMFRPAVIHLPPTKTHELRELEFRRATKYGFPVCGVLEIRERKSSASKARPQVRRYAVQEVPFGRADGSNQTGRRFRLSKPLSSGEEPYYVSMPDGDHCVCHCRGFDKSGWCSHIQCLRELLRGGYLAGPRPADAGKEPKELLTGGEPIRVR